jgi:hypothetical protein
MATGKNSIITNIATVGACRRIASMIATAVSRIPHSNPIKARSAELARERSALGFVEFIGFVTSLEASSDALVDLIE